MIEPLVVSPLAVVSKVVGLLEAKNAYEVFVEEGSRVGLVSIRSLLNVTNPGNRRVGGLMTYVPKLTVESSLEEAARIMSEHRVRGLPVVEEGRISGCLPTTALVKAVVSTRLGDVKASKIMTPHPATIEPADPSSKARLIMLRRRFDHLPVIDNKRIKGLVTSSHIVFQMIRPRDFTRYVIGVPDALRRLDAPIQALMEPHPLLTDPQTPIGTVAYAMFSRDSSSALVEFGGELQGVITNRDFVKLIGEDERAVGIPIYIVGLPKDPFEAEVAKTKFVRSVKTLTKSFPQILEARATIKTPQVVEEQRRRYEVGMMIKTPRELFSNSALGYDLAEIFDIVSNRIKRIIASKEYRRRKSSPRFSIRRSHEYL